MSPRRLVPVVLDSNVETGDQLPVPRLSTLTARVERGRLVHDGRRVGTPFEQRPLWSSTVRADGWAAQWPSFRAPPPGSDPVVLQGRVTIDFGALCRCWIRGRVSRLWFTYARREQSFDYWDPRTWEPVRGSRGRIELEDWPATVQGWPALPPGATESGRLIELDLDDVPDGRTGGTHLDPHPTDPRPRPGRSSRGSG